VPKSLSLGEAARPDGVRPEALVEKLGAFFDARMAPSLRKPESPAQARSSESGKETEQCPS
jgi:hypothetical protein